MSNYDTINSITIYTALVDIEISALELSTGNFEADTFESDCEHIATLASKLRDLIEADYSGHSRANLKKILLKPSDQVENFLFGEVLS